MTDGQAHAGAADLSRYLQQVRANNPSGHLTVLGHSYGSLTASLALQDLDAQSAHPVNDVVFYGSPGLELYSPAQLGLDHGHAYVMQAPHDLITNLVAPLAPTPAPVAHLARAVVLAHRDRGGPGLPRAA